LSIVYLGFYSSLLFRKDAGVGVNIGIFHQVVIFKENKKGVFVWEKGYIKICSLLAGARN